MTNYKIDRTTFVQCGSILRPVPSDLHVLELHKKIALGTGAHTLLQIDDNENPYVVPTGKTFHMLAFRTVMANGTAVLNVYQGNSINSLDTIKLVISLSANLYSIPTFAVLIEPAQTIAAGKYITFQASAAYIREIWVTGYETFD